MQDKGIVIPHHPSNKLFLDDLVASIKSEYPIYICVDGKDKPENSYELGAIKSASEMFDEFIFIQDSCLIKDNSLFDKLFEIDGTVALTNGFYHYMGKYITKQLPNIPVANHKEDAIHWEIRWFNKPYTIFNPELPVHTNVFEEKHGRKNMKLENDYIIKYKGTWRC